MVDIIAFIRSRIDSWRSSARPYACARSLKSLFGTLTFITSNQSFTYEKYFLLLLLNMLIQTFNKYYKFKRFRALQPILLPNNPTLAALVILCATVCEKSFVAILTIWRSAPTTLKWVLEILCVIDSSEEVQVRRSIIISFLTVFPLITNP